MAALEEMMSNLKVDASTVNGSASEETSCISSARDLAVDVKKGDKDDEHFSSTHQSSVSATSANTSYYGYTYPGFDPTFGSLEEQSYYVAGDTAELHYPVMQADNGSLIYLTSGTQPSYDPYSHYLPVTVVGVDGYAHPLSPMFQPSIGSPGYLQTPVMVQSPYLYDLPTFGVDGGYENGYGSILESPVSKPGLSSHNHKHAPPSKTSFNDSLELKKSSLPTLDAPSGRSMHNQLKPVGKSDLQLEGHYPCVKFPSYGQGKGGMLCANNHDKTNTKAWGINANPKVKSRVTNVGNLNLLNEQKYGIRTTNGKGSFIFGGNAVGSLATDGKGNSNSLASVTRRDQYNLPDFPTKYDHAFFFVIKSYSEDDVHKSIKYNVWASTPNGNKRLDNAYQVAQEKSKEKGTNCPVFLFFSVNASGQFCGVAEMIGRVDFDKNMDFWQQDKWNGYFPVKWHIIKDVPNPQLRHIILENNENKPVTNSRDTQEVRFPQGTEMLNILKNYTSKTSILDDFEFYESRQRVMLEKRHRPLMPHLEHKQKTEELITEEGKAGERAKE